jgi:hypothetical protein
MVLRMYVLLGFEGRMTVHRTVGTVGTVGTVVIVNTP